MKAVLRDLCGLADFAKTIADSAIKPGNALVQAGDL
jgi:hypothetical protein